MVTGRPVIPRNAWDRFAQAIEHYEKFGFKYESVPWTASWEGYRITAPEYCRALTVFETGNWGVSLPLVASAEQSFLSLPFQGRAQGITPCFRDDGQDKLHLPHFMKLELYDNLNPCTTTVLDMLEAAVKFYTNFLPVKVEAVEQECPPGVNQDSTFDIFSEDGVELGSYGLRWTGDRAWCYGTGLAEPRLSQVLNEL